MPSLSFATSVRWSATTCRGIRPADRQQDPSERLALALGQGGRIHPQYPAEFETGVSVAWHRVTWNLGSWSNTNSAARARLSEPQGRGYQAGDHLNMHAWMQGAFESGRQVATALHARATADRATVQH